MATKTVDEAREEAQKDTVYVCESCDWISTETAGEPLYECNGCGTRFNRSNSANYNHQCPDCYKFASKLADDSCTECAEGPVEAFDGVECPNCDEWLKDDDFDAHWQEHHANDDDEDTGEDSDENDEEVDF